jgi:NADH:ubiquinone oxidoreductase subunit
MAERQRVSFNTWMSMLYIRLLVHLRGEAVGTDRFGNEYFQEKQARTGMRRRRWVLYNGEPEASKVPPEWYGWMRHTNAAPLPESGPGHPTWMREYVPNRTGTAQAYRPAGHQLEQGARPAATGDYQPWTPS